MFSKNTIFLVVSFTIISVHASEQKEDDSHPPILHCASLPIPSEGFMFSPNSFTDGGKRVPREGRTLAEYFRDNATAKMAPSTPSEHLTMSGKGKEEAKITPPPAKAIGAPNADTKILKDTTN